MRTEVRSISTEDIDQLLNVADSFSHRDVKRKRSKDLDILDTVAIILDSEPTKENINK